MGPLIEERAVKAVAEKVERAVKQGATLVCGGKRAEGRGYFFEPTLLTDTDNNMDIMKEETFGPVLPVSTFDTLDQVIALANDCEFGLTSSVYTTNLNEAFYVTRRLQFGETYINRENFEAMQGFHAGWKKSGIGGADGMTDRLKQQARMMMRLSSLTLPHGMVRVLLTEQLYRAVSILHNHPYHRE